MTDPTDRVLDWRPRHDPLSRNWSIRTLIGGVERHDKFWRTPLRVLDQGAEGACVGFGWTCELMSWPVPVRFENPDRQARGIYRTAKVIDEWEGEDYEGTSVLAGAKVNQLAGYVGEYRWAFGIDDVIDTLVTTGPVVIGVPWLNGMFYPDSNGLLDVSGPAAGGHCVCLTGYTTSPELIRGRNSWGPGWGVRGSFWIRTEDLARLLDQDGEACVPTVRYA